MPGSGDSEMYKFLGESALKRLTVQYRRHNPTDYLTRLQETLRNGVRKGFTRRAPIPGEEFKYSYVNGAKTLRSKGQNMRLERETVTRPQRDKLMRFFKGERDLEYKRRVT